MNQANALAATSALRILPLPGRDDAGAAAKAAPARQAGTPGLEAPPPLSAATERGGGKDDIIIFAALPAGLAQSLKLAPYMPRAAFSETRQKLADPMIGFLLSANEVQGSTAAPPSRAGHVSLDSYRNAAAGFPHGSDSLFSLVG